MPWCYGINDSYHKKLTITEEAIMDSKNLLQIDPALSLMKDFSKINLGTTQAIQQLRQQVLKIEYYLRKSKH